MGTILMRTQQFGDRRVSRLVPAALLAMCMAVASCASLSDEQGGLAETETQTGGAVGGADGSGSADNASGVAESSAGDDGTAASDAGETTAATLGEIVDDGSSDAKQLAAKTILDMSQVDPAPNADSADVAALVFAQPNDGEIENAFGVDRWTFEAEAGILMAVDVLAIDHDCRQDLTMVLEAPSGARGEVAWVGNGGCAAHGPVLLEESGTHVLEFQGGDGAAIPDTTGSYRFVPLVLNERDVAEVPFDQPVDGEIVEIFGVDRWSFAATEGQQLVVDVLSIDHECRQDLTLTIEDPFGEREEISWIGNGGCNAYEPIEIGRDGQHVLEFHGGSGNAIPDVAGAYRFLVTFLTERDEEAATAGTLLEGEISQTFGSDRWTFDANEGQNITIEVLSIDHECRQDLTLTIEDPFGEQEEVAWIGNGGCKAYEPIELQRSGTHTIIFQGGSGNAIPDTTGAYSFTFNLG